MVRQIRPAKVYQAVRAELNSRILPQYAQHEPPWFKVLYSIPPSETLTRPVPVRHQVPNSKARRPKGVFRPQPLVFPEDRLRETFYKDHPWELARPRIIAELDGKDSHLWDWSKGVRQPGTQLSGECVVQRQVWLMENESMSEEEAYDKARKEFYALRQEEEIERRVTREEARHVGAYFNKSRIDISMELEDREYELWKEWAGKQVEARANSSTVITFDDPAAAATTDEVTEDAAEATLPASGTA